MYVATAEVNKIAAVKKIGPHKNKIDLHNLLCS